MRWTAVSNVGRGAIGVLQIAVLARLIDKQDFGLMAQAVAVVGTLQLATDVGVGSAIMHYRDITTEQLSSLFWLNLFTGFVLTLLVAVASPGISAFFGEPRLVGILLLFSLMFVLIAVGQQLRVLAEKELQFAVLARIEVFSSIVGFIAATVLAALGGGVYALAAGALTTSAAVSILCWAKWGRQHRPQFVFHFNSIKKFVIFGGHVVGSNLVSALGAQGDIFVFGRLFSASALGLYTQPRELNMRFIAVINPVITRVGLPLIASNQSDRNLVGRIYKNTVLMICSFTMPAYAAAALMSHEIVTLFLGARWADSSEFLRATAIWCMVRAIGNPIGSLLNGMGRAHIAFLATIIVTILVFVSAIAGASLAGPIGVPYGLALLYAALIYPFWYFLVRPITDVGCWDYHQQIARPLLASGVATVCAWGALRFVDGALLRLVVGSVSFGLSYLAASMVVNRIWVGSLMELGFGAARKNLKNPFGSFSLRQRS